MTDESIFAEAQQITDISARLRFLERACEGRPEVRKEVEQLLAAASIAGSFMAKPAARLDVTGDFTPSEPAAIDSISPAGELGMMIAGRYHLVGILGEGGMGTVYRANQTEPVKREVALKLIKSGMDSKAVLARFDAERQALAMMDHPNIARVYDGGRTPAGQPYFVMELVNGIPLTEYCDQKRLSVKSRLELFVAVCQAVQHAHQKGIIHRDLKPSNVLVTEVDGRPTPKVIDFGVAKATEQKLTDMSFADVGAIVGTPSYMSPEQADPGSMDIDTRTDVYALGVILYEMLVGSPPIDAKDFKRGAILEMLRMVREVDPPRPSTKLSTADALPNIAANRSIEPAQLERSLKGDLDWIVMKALEKDRSRRYETANGFAADLLRHLAFEPVLAAPPSRAYRMRKFVRKNRAGVLAAGLVLLALLAGMAGTTWQAIRAEREADRANAEADKVREERKLAQAARDVAELNLIRSFLRPIGYNTEKLDQAEMIAMGEVARQEDDRIKLLFLAEALKDGDTALRVARRAQHVAHAAVGPSPTRLARALKLVMAKQRDPSVDPRVRLCACWLAIELSGDDLPAMREAFDTLLARKATDWKNFVPRLTHLLRQKHTAVLFDCLVAALGKTADESALMVAGEGLAALAPRLDPAAAAKGVEALVAEIGKATNYPGLRTATNGLAALAPRLDPAAAAKGFEALVGVLGKATLADSLGAAGEGFAALAPRLDASEAAKKFDSLLRVLSETTDESAISAAAAGIAALAPRLEPASAVRGFDALVVVLDKSTEYGALNAAGKGITALAPRLDPTTAAKEFDALMGFFGKTTLANTMGAAGDGMEALAPRLDPTTAAREFVALMGVLGKTEGHAFKAARKGVRALALRVGSGAVDERFEALVAGLGKTTDSKELTVAGNEMAALAPLVDSTVAAKGLEALLAAIGKTTDIYAQGAIQTGLEALAPRLDPATTAKGFETLLELAGKTKNGRVLSTASGGVTALSSRMGPSAAARGFEALVHVLGMTKDYSTVFDVWDGLTTLAPLLESTDAARAFEALVSLLDKTTNEYAIIAATKGLAALAPRLDSTAAAKGVDVLLTVLQNTKDGNSMRFAAVGLIALAPRTNSIAVLRGFEIITRRIESKEMIRSLHEEDDSFIDDSLGTYGPSWLVSLAAYLPPEIRNDKCREAMRQFLASSQTRTARSMTADRLYSLVAYIESVDAIAELLLEPACMDEPKDAILRRLEELAYPDPSRTGRLVGLGASPFTAATIAIWSSQQDAADRQNRRFRTTFDAANWLGEKHPAINLDRPYRPKQ